MVSKSLDLRQQTVTYERWETNEVLQFPKLAALRVRRVGRENLDKAQWTPTVKEMGLGILGNLGG